MVYRPFIMKVKHLVLIILVVITATATYSLFFQKPNESVKIISYDCVKDKSAFDLLLSSFKIETKDTNLGKMVTAIEGVKPADKEFWAFYIDGKSSPVGVEQYKCTDKEKIEWKLEAFQ